MHFFANTLNKLKKSKLKYRNHKPSKEVNKFEKYFSSEAEFFVAAGKSWRELATLERCVLCWLNRSALS